VSYPGASATSPLAINNNGVVVGLYVLPDGSTHAFSLTKGTFANIDVPFATSVIDWANGINDSGDIVGVFYDSTVHHDRGWLLRGGVYTAIDYPAATLTTTTGINNAGVIVGQYSTASGSGSFLWTAGTITPLNCTCGTTTLTSINNSGMIAGYYVNGTGTHGLEYSSGKFVTLDYPGTADTYFTSINDTGTLAGWFYDYSNSVYRGFKYAAGQYSAIKIPPAPYNSVVYLAVNNSGQTVGATYNLNTAARGNGFFLSTGPYAYVPEFNAGSVSVFDVSFDLPVTSIPVGAGPINEGVSPDGSFVYISNWGASSVSVINSATNTVVASIPVGPYPGGIAITPDGSTLYVGSNVIDVVYIATLRVKSTIPV
jgi:YVTN family beta-propeller protein